MKRWILLLCCILLALSVTGCTGENSSSGSSSEPSSSQTQLQEDPVDPETAAALELVAEADCEVPDFLTEEQQTLYRKAYTAYKQFALYTDGFGSTEYNPVTVEEYDNSFCVGNGSITTWKDYETAMLVNSAAKSASHTPVSPQSTEKSIRAAEMSTTPRSTAITEV